MTSASLEAGFSAAPRPGRRRRSALDDLGSTASPIVAPVSDPAPSYGKSADSLSESPWSGHPATPGGAECGVTDGGWKRLQARDGRHQASRPSGKTTTEEAPVTGGLVIVRLRRAQARRSRKTPAPAKRIPSRPSPTDPAAGIPARLTVLNVPEAVVL